MNKLQFFGHGFIGKRGLLAKSEFTNSIPNAAIQKMQFIDSANQTMLLTIDGINKAYALLYKY